MHESPIDDGALTRAIELSTEARERGDHPFSALLLLDGEIVHESYNRVNTDGDLTAHAETVLIRELEQAGRLDELARGTVYASCEPCPMCTGAMFWAGARHIVFGLSHASLNRLSTEPGESTFGFDLSAAAIAEAGQPVMRVQGPFREDEAGLPHVGFWWHPED